MKEPIMIPHITPILLERRRRKLLLRDPIPTMIRNIRLLKRSTLHSALLLRGIIPSAPNPSTLLLNQPQRIFIILWKYKSASSVLLPVRVYIER